MAVGDAYVFPGFLTPVLTLLFFQSHRLLFSHASAEVRGENTPERKVASTWDRTHNHQVMSPTRSPLSHPGGSTSIRNRGKSCQHREPRNNVSNSHERYSLNLWESNQPPSCHLKSMFVKGWAKRPGSRASEHRCKLGHHLISLNTCQAWMGVWCATRGLMTSNQLINSTFCTSEDLIYLSGWKFCCGAAWALALYFYLVLKCAYGGSHIVFWVPALFVTNPVRQGLFVLDCSSYVIVYYTLLTITNKVKIMNFAYLLSIYRTFCRHYNWVFLCIFCKNYQFYLTENCRLALVSLGWFTNISVTDELGKLDL